MPGVAVVPTSIVAWPDFSTLGAGLNVEVFARLGVLAACLAIFSIMLSDFFDTMGTVIGIGAEARWLDKTGRLPRMNRVLLVDSLARERSAGRRARPPRPPTSSPRPAWRPAAGPG